MMNDKIKRIQSTHQSSMPGRVKSSTVISSSPLMVLLSGLDTRLMQNLLANLDTSHDKRLYCYIEIYLELMRAILGVW